MAGINKQRSAVETYSKNRQLVTGNFKLNGTSNPTGLSGELAKLGSVARTGTGVLVFTFSKKPGKLKHVICALRGAFTAGDYMKYTYSEANGTITVSTFDGGGATDIPDAEGIWIEVSAWVSHMTKPVLD